MGHLTGANDGVDPALTWSYDGQGNLLTAATGGTTTTYSYATTPNTANELAGLAAPGQATQDYTYDSYGNTLSIGPSPSNPCPSGTSTCLGYDAQARLSSVTEPNYGPTIALTYNAMGLRASYTVTPYGASQPSLSEQFTYRGGQLAQTVVVSGAATYTDTYVYSQHGLPLELLRTTNGVLNRYWYLRDGLGNVVALTDASGHVVDQYAYDLWGKPTTVQETVPQQLRYQGYWYDNELGWYWLSSRSYDPALKRFLQPDPSEMDGLFSYVYVGDDPVDGSDPSGFSAAAAESPPETFYRVIWGKPQDVAKARNWTINPATWAEMAKGEPEGLSVWDTAAAAANAANEANSFRDSPQSAVIAQISLADIQQVARVVPSMPPWHHWVIIPNQAPKEQADANTFYGTLGAQATYTGVAVDKQGNVTGPVEPQNTAGQSNAFVSTVGAIVSTTGAVVGATWAATQSVAATAVQVVAIVLTGSAIVSRYRMMAF